jgi:hypothetical protein
LNMKTLECWFCFLKVNTIDRYSRSLLGVVYSNIEFHFSLAT